MNAANEAAVGAFLKGKIGFLDIENTVRSVYNEFEPVNRFDNTLDDILGYSNEAYRKAEEKLGL